MAALHECRIRDLAGRMRAGEIAPTAVLDHFLRRIERLNPKLNAFVALDPGARSAAEEAGKRLRDGRPLSGLDGIPVAVKDNLLVRGLVASWGTRLYADRVPDADELPIERLRAAGAVIVGKTNVPAFTLEGYTDNDVFGVTRNPWDLSLTPGGSSGGAVAAVAAGLVPLAVGTDGGGSIRRPAAHTGLVGLKPGLGCVARAGGFPQILHDFEVVGPLARRVDDVRMAMDVLAGADRRDPRSRFRAPGESAPDSEPGRLRVRFVERFGDHPVDPAIVESVTRAANRMAALGHHVEAGPLPLDVEGIAARWPLLGRVGLAMLAAMEPAFGEVVEDKYRAMAEEGAAIPASEYIAFLEQISAFRTAVGQMFEAVDLIMMPATAAQPWPADQAFPTRIDGREVGPRGHAVFTGWVNAAGHPAIALPCEPDRNGLPIGFQLVADMGKERQLLDVAEGYEKSFGFSALWPAVATA